MLVGFNPKLESPVFNARILKTVKRGLKVYKIGPAEDLTYDYIHLGNSIKDLTNILQDKDGFKKLFGEGTNNHILFSGNLANELSEFNQIF